MPFNFVFEGNPLKKSNLFISLVCVMLLFMGACKESEKIKVDFRNTETVTYRKYLDRQKPLKATLGGIFTPKQEYIYFKGFLDYLEQQLGRKIDIVETDSYAEVCNLLKYKEVDFAFVNPQSYIDGHKDFGMELLTAPVISGNSQSRAYIIARDDSQVNEFKDLKGKVLALTDPKSDKMCQLPLYMLGAETGNPRKYFKNCVFSFGSDETIDVVALGLADGGLVNSVVWDYLRSKNYKYALKTKIIWKSPVFCSPPVVVHPALPQAVKDELQKAFLTANEYKKGKQALDDMMIDKYVVVDDSDYGSLREIESYFADNLPDERRRTEKK